MSDYISREAALSLKYQYYSHSTNCYESVIHIDDLRNLPAADVVEVAHGEWIPVTNGRGGSECNLCHAYAPSYQSGTEYNSPYCPNYGAKMGGDGE